MLAEDVRLLYARSRVAQAAVVFVAAVVAFIFLGRASAAESLGWLLLL